jgi:hypothetical protein
MFFRSASVSVSGEHRRAGSGLRVIAQRLNEQCAHLFRLLSLHPMAGAIEKMESTGHAEMALAELDGVRAADVLIVLLPGGYGSKSFCSGCGTALQII